MEKGNTFLLFFFFLKTLRLREMEKADNFFNAQELAYFLHPILLVSLIKDCSCFA